MSLERIDEIKSLESSNAAHEPKRGRKWPLPGTYWFLCRLSVCIVNGFVWYFVGGNRARRTCLERNRPALTTKIDFDDSKWSSTRLAAIFNELTVCAFQLQVHSLAVSWTCSRSYSRGKGKHQSWLSNQLNLTPKFQLDLLNIGHVTCMLL